MTQIPVQAAPAKRFFVEMLTRDIELGDAILDLLDNCVDGAIRTNVGREVSADQPYEGFWAKVTLSEEGFVIEDNCGGIGQDLATDYAFRLGRPDIERDKDIPTVGMYGIGMKRAIFKMGYESRVASRVSEGEGFVVQIPRAWMEDDHDWELELDTDVIDVAQNGTMISVRDLREGVSRQFSDDTGFVKTLRDSVSAYYGYIIAKGFSVFINDEPIQPIRVNFLSDERALSGGEAIAPFVFESNVDGVDVSVTVGLYAPLGNNEDDDPAASRPSVDRAGWTIICNDRVVLYADRTRVTGWGDANVPAYHPQFVSIAGVVIFNSKDAKKLPVTTTKRGVEGNSDLYLAVKNVMRDGLKQFTDFTNKWKSPSEERAAAMRGATSSYLAQDVGEHVKNEQWKINPGELRGKLFKPKLPKPKDIDPVKSIQFSRQLKEINEVREYFDDTGMSNSQVGTKCFEYVLQRARK
ncbi:TPA: ATP-binding protein [Stenotrophomonas maltophilia]|nr:ATP-binding protein [Stenotrophomonas maltophilia]HDS1042198.1 ATP-binding protein [Stenotrophomonas maltophilia]